MTIKDVEKKLNISRANIRFYEKEGLLSPKRNNDNEYRNYSEEDIKKLEKILLFRKCNVSIENIRLIFNEEKSIDEVFKEQIHIIENEVKELEGAKMMCKKLAREKSSINEIDTDKYIHTMNEEEEKGNKFYNIKEDYIFATEKLYQSIIENKEFKGGRNMKKGIRAIVYTVSFILTCLLFVLFDYIFNKNIDLDDAIYFSAVITILDLIGVKKYIENKTNTKFTRKDYIRHIIITIILMVVSLVGFYTIKSIYTVNNGVNDNVMEMSIKKHLISMVENKYQKNDNDVYAESHKILDYEIKNDNIYVYLVADYGLLDTGSCKMIGDTKDVFTIILKKDKNSEGIYDLIEYKESTIPDNLKNKVNVNYDEIYFKAQLNSYCAK